MGAGEWFLTPSSNQLPLKFLSLSSLIQGILQGKVRLHFTGKKYNIISVERFSFFICKLKIIFYGKMP